MLAHQLGLENGVELPQFVNVRRLSIINMFDNVRTPGYYHTTISVYYDVL